MSAKDIDALNRTTGTHFSQLSAGDKMSYIGKVLVFVISFGFAFPTLFSD